MGSVDLPEIGDRGTYLVTGASGFIGRMVCRKLLESGAAVCGASRTAPELESPKWTHFDADLTDAAAADELLEQVRPEFVIHLASSVTGKRGIEWIRETFAANLQAAVNVLVAAQNNGTSKLVLAGSLEEPDPSDPRPIAASPYAASNWGASTYARTMHALYGTRTAVARIFMVYGPGQQDLTKLVPYVCTAAARGEAPLLMSGRRQVDWIYVDDVADGLIALCHRGPTDGGHVDLGSGETVTTGEIAQRICTLAATGVEPRLGALPDRPMEQVRKADPKATRDSIGWSPSTPLEVGLERTFDWYRRLAGES